MKTTLTPPYIGVDPTSRYSAAPRDIDVCGITRRPDCSFDVCFWTWAWDSASSLLDISAIAAEIRRSRIVLIDGPQGLAQAPRSRRACEAVVGAAGKTGHRGPTGFENYGGFIASSLDLFAALHSAGVRLSDPAATPWCGEVYPADLWRSLAPALPDKASTEGNAARRRLLNTVGLKLPPETLTHDQLDAAISAVAAAVLDGQVEGLRAELVGDPLVFDPEHAILREGPIVRLTVTSNEFRRRLEQAIEAARNDAPTDAVVRAEKLLERFADAANSGHPVIASYSWVHDRLFAGQSTGNVRSIASAVIKVAVLTRKRAVKGLGSVALDTFVVNASSRIPGDGHWASAGYDLKQWSQILGRAHLLHGPEKAPWESES